LKNKIVLIIAVIVFIILVLGVFITFKIFTKDKYTSADAAYFASLIQYKTDSINDSENLNKILENTELNKYITKTEKSVDNGKEHLTVYYKGYENDKIGWFYNHENSIVETNAVVLFALINNLEKLTYFDLDTSKEYAFMEYDRETMNSYYNQDVRNYINNPNEFLRYNIDTNISNITIYINEYTSDSMQTRKIEVNDSKKIEEIADLIKQQNFGIPDMLTDCMINTWIDLNNGYMIGVYCSDTNNLGAVVKANGKDVFEGDGSVDNTMIINKTLPSGFKDYIMNIISNDTSNIENETKIQNTTEIKNDTQTYTDKQLIDIAYNCLNDTMKAEISNKDNADVMYWSKSDYPEMMAVDLNGNHITIKDKDIIIVSFKKADDSIMPNRTDVVLDNSTKEIIGLPLML